MLNINTGRSSLKRDGPNKPIKKPESGLLKKAAPKTRVTDEFVLVLNTFVSHPDTKITGYDVIHGSPNIRGTDLKSGTVYPMLYRMEQKGWIELEREVFDPNIEPPKRPPRNYYKLTSTGLKSGKKLLLERDKQLQKLLTRNKGGYREVLA